MVPGAAVTPLEASDGHIDLFATRDDGTVMSTFYAGDGPWQPWFPIHFDGNGDKIAMAPGATVTAFRRTAPQFLQPEGGMEDDGHIDLFATRDDGTVMSTFYEGQGPWQPWFPIDPGPHSRPFKTTPGATVTAVSPRHGHIDLFATRDDGTVMSTYFEFPYTLSWFGQYRGHLVSWQPWFPVGLGADSRANRMAPGATVTAVVPRLGHIDLFATRDDGTVMSTYFEGDGPWQPWFPVDSAAEGGSIKTAPGATITAIAAEGNIDLFASRQDGTVMSTFFAGNGPSWQQWFPINLDEQGSSVQVARAATVTASGELGDRIGLFAIRDDGTVIETHHERYDDWAWWTQIDLDAEGRPVKMVKMGNTAKQPTVTAVLPSAGPLSLFAVRDNGTVMSTYSDLS
jgi:hypothetical protein